MRLTIKMVEAGCERKGEKERRRKRRNQLVEKRERWWNHHMRWSNNVVEMVVDRPVMKVVVANGHGGERKKVAKTGKEADFLIQFSSCSGHVIHPYL
jgi:hypothetical protein